jgi:hypothetical protein
MSKTTIISQLAAANEIIADLSSVTERNDRMSLAVSASWADFNIRAKRTMRHAVVVDADTPEPKSFPSVGKALDALGLGRTKLIPFRMALVEHKALTFAGHRFDLAA